MKILTLLALFVLIITIACEEHQQLELETPYEKSLTQFPFVGRYIFNIGEKQVKKLNSDKWYFFVELEPNEDKEWIQTQIQLSVGKKDSEDSTKVKSCDAIEGGVDSCFLTSKQFKYQTEQVHVRIRCRGECKFKLSGEISTPFKIQPGSSIKMDFQNTAYSKVFTLDTTKAQEFDQLRIILRPQGFLQFPAPIGLYLNQDDTIPTKERHSMKGMTLWDNGQGIFIDMPDAKGKFTILVTGPQKNILILETKLVSLTQTNVLTENLPFFDYVGAESSKLYKTKVNPSKGACFQMTTFSGAVQLVGIYDEDETPIEKQEFPQLFHTYGEIVYQLDAEFFKKNKKNYNIDNYIIFQVAGVKQSTFVVESYELNPSITHLIHDKTRYVEIPANKYHQYFIQIVQLDEPEFKRSQFQIILTTEETKTLKIRFFNCKKQHGVDCQLKNSEVFSNSISDKDIVEINSYQVQHMMDGVEIYKFSIPASKFTKFGNYSKKYTLSFLIQNEEIEEQLYTIQYLNSGRNVYLKEGQTKKDRVSIGEVKYYVFTNTNTEVEEIRIHVMEIAGRVFMEGYLEDPRTNDLSGQEILDYHNSVRFEKIKKDQTIYLKIEGKENAYFSLQLQLIKQSERNWWNRTHPGGKGYNQIILVEDISYEFNIAPKGREVYQLHSKTEKFNLDISSLMPLDLCMTENLKSAPFPPNCEVIEHLSKNKQYDIILEKGKIGNIGVTNSNDKEVKFNIRFTGSKSVKPIIDNSTQSDIKCLLGHLGKITKFNFKKDTSSCYSYVLDKKEDLEVVVDILSDQYDKVNIIAEVNGVQKVEVIGSTHLFKKAEITKACQGKDKCPFKLFINSKVDTEVRFTTQYLTGTFQLLDGIANQFTGTKQDRHFIYELYNKVNTTIVLENKNGFYKFYGKVVEANDYYKSKLNEFAFPSSQDKDVESNNPFYFQYQISVLTQTKIEISKCTECLLLLTVVREEQSFNPNEKSRFIIECTQQQRFLKQNKPIASFLSKRSIAFYEFYNPNNGSLLVLLNTQNQNCIGAYVKKGEEVRASGSDYDKRSQDSNPNQVLLENALEGAYSITLQAVEDCYYSIDVTSSSSNQTISTIQQGIYKDVNIGKNQVVKFAYENMNNDETIKILTLHESGQLTINVKVYDSIKTLLKDNSTKLKYQWSGKDFLKITKNDTNYCSNCVYLIAITANRQTKTSIMVPAKNSQFPIVVDSSIKDELLTGETQNLRIFTLAITEFQINVNYGEVKVEMISSNKDKVYFTQNYKANGTTQYQNITYKDDPAQIGNDFTFMRYNKVKITAISNAGFTFGFISSRDEAKRGNKVKYGIPEYVSLTGGKKQCLRGVLDDINEQFLISITGEKQLALMDLLEIQCSVNGTQLKLDKNIAKNQMIVKFNQEKVPKSLPAEYEFCMKSKDDVFLTFIHSSKLNYFPENQIIMVSNSMNLSFYAEGKSLIEVNECTSRAVTSISHSFNSIGGVNSEIRQVRKSNNIIQFDYYGPVYISVVAKTATVSWRRKDELSKKSSAYDEYSSNKIRMEKDGSRLLVEVYPLRKLVDNPAASFKNVEFSAFIAEQQMNLYDAMNCRHGNYITKSISSSPSDKALILSFQIDNIIKQFQNKKYILIGIQAIATSNITGDQKYRFIYPYQQVLLSGLTADGNLIHDDDISVNPPKPVTPTESGSWFNTFVIYFTLTVVVAFLAIWVYRKWIKNLLKKRKREQLSEQGTGEVRYQEFASYT